MLDGVKLTMCKPDLERLQSIKTLPSLVAYLKRDLDWPIEADEIEDVFFEYDPEELGLVPEQAAGIKEIKQLRPMDSKQPWGIFWVNFEKKRLPVVMLRRILGHLVIKRRASANKAAQKAWYANDLLFISAYGEENDRAITFAHFAQNVDSTCDLPVLKVLGWDGGDTVLHLADAHRTLTEKLRWPTNPDNLAAWHDQWAEVFTLRHREVISTTTELVEELAKLATSIRKRADAILSRESDRGPMRQLYGAFKTALIHDLSEDDFADVIAQTISYGLLAARFSSKGGISIKSLIEMIPPTNSFLRELLAELLTVAGRKKGAFDFDELGIQDVVDLLNQANAEAVKSDFGNRTRNEDPVIHFYEHFLKAYDKKKKVQRGVFFTPQPVVSYIVRSVHELLQTEFGLDDGLADTTTWGEMVKRNKDLKIPEGAKSSDPFVLILDPATGTATFLVEVIEVIFTHLKKKWTDLEKKPAEISRLWNEYVPKNLLPRLYGYELMMAPYTIAHMKLALKLQEINVRLGQPDFQFMYTDRAHIYLTNSLEPAGDDKQGVLDGIFPALAHEAAAVKRVKKSNRFTVVIGNPPYSVSSQNKGEYIEGLLEDYKTSVRGTTNIQPLSDDYIKFLRLSQELITGSTVGLVGLVTNNVFLDGLMHRSIRSCMLSVYSSIRILNLHGNTTIRERTPCGGKDENVFDIKQGVCVSLFARRLPTSCDQVHSADLYGDRTSKYYYLLGHDGRTIQNILTPSAPHFFFVPKDFLNEAEYSTFMALTDIMPTYSTGVATHRDHFLVDTDCQLLRHRIESFCTGSIAHATNSLGLTDTRDWSVSEAKKKLRRLDPSALRNYAYKPFSRHFIYYDPDLIDSGCSRIRLMQSMSPSNIALIMRKKVTDSAWKHVFVTREIVDFNFYNYISMVFPLYVSGGEGELLLDESGRRANLSRQALKWVTSLVKPTEVSRIDLNSNELPEIALSYFYAVLHSHDYRTRYAEFLKIDFPRLPLTSRLDLFCALAKLGGELVALHLMESPRLDKHITRWIGGRNPKAEKVTYSDKTVWIDKAQTTGFKGVPEDVWNFHIGGYQVCEKWLKDRKGRTLSQEDTIHYQKIIVAISETIGIMAEIDKVIEKYGGWPGAFQKKVDD